MSSIYQEVNKWRKKILSKFFNYKNGFFEFPYQFTHPSVLVESMKALPFMRHNAEEQCLRTNTPFFKGAFYYFKLEEGLWVTIFESFYKTDIAFINTDQEVTRGFYNLSYVSYKQGNHTKGRAHLNGKTLIDSNWTLYHPGEELTACHYKNTSSLIICFSFDEEWLQKNLSISDLAKDNPLKILFSSEFKYNPFIRNPVKDAEQQLEKLFETLKRIKEGESVKFSFKSKSTALISDFFEGLTKNLLEINFSKEDKDMMIKLVNYLEKNLLADFPGITFLATHIDCSPTKVKTLFKQWFGISTLQWFRGKQMDLALKLLKEDKIKIKDVAFSMGYSNPSKFTVSFNKHHNFNPSDV